VVSTYSRAYVSCALIETHQRTLQEGLAANSNSLVLCGSRTVAWQTVLQALKDLHRSARRYADPSLHRLRYFLEVHALHRTSQRVTLEKLVFASSDREASNPRDYVYALLGLVNDPSYEEIRPDYTKSSSWAFQQGMITMIKSRQDLDLLVAKLLLESPRNVRRSAWVSWCADFSKNHVFQHMNVTYLQNRFSMMEDGASTGRHLQTVSHDAEKGTLTLSGTIVGTILQTMVIDNGARKSGKIERMAGSSILSKFEVPDNIAFIEKLRVLTDFASVGWAKLPNQKTGAKAAAGDGWKIVANGRHMEYVLDETPLSNDIYRVLPIIEKLDWVTLRGLTFHRIPTQKEKFIAYLAARVDWKHYLGTTFTDADFENAWNAISCLDGRWVQDTCIFTTHEGYIGSGSYAIKRDDVVCILFGCKIPVVMRRGSSGTYKIIDAVYVDGIMGGEFLRDEAGYTVTEFEIN
jgi:hypothetical protein